MRELVPTGRRQGGLKRRRPLPVDPGHTPNLVRCQVQLAKHTAERLASIDGIHELLPHFNR